MIIQNEKEKVLSQNIKVEQEKTQTFPKNMSMSGITIEQVGKKYKGTEFRMSCGVKFPLAD